MNHERTTMFRGAASTTTASDANQRLTSVSENYSDINRVNSEERKNRQGLPMAITEVMVTPSSSTATRKRRFASLSPALPASSSEAHWNDQAFRSSCKKRFLERSRHNNRASALIPFPPSGSVTDRVDLLRNIVQEELLQLQQQQLVSPYTATHSGETDNMTCDATSIHEQLEIQPQRQLPLANHFIDDDELYDLLIEMELESKDNIAVNQHQYESQTERTSITMTAASTTTAMSDCEEDMYHRTMQQQQEDDDAMHQEQIMDYYFNQGE